MTKKKNEDMRILKYMLCAVLGVLLLPGCDKWLEVQPYDQMAEGDLLGKEEGFRKLLNGIYVDLNKDELYGQTLTVEMVEIMACSYLIGTDALTWGNYIDLDNRNFESEYWRTRLDNTWNTAYALIRNCNTILEQMAGKESLFTGNDYDLIRGEALALRALLHFDMFRLFGPVLRDDYRLAGAGTLAGHGSDAACRGGFGRSGTVVGGRPYPHHHRSFGESCHRGG